MTETAPAIAEGPIDEAAVDAAVGSDAHGAIVTFRGVVRDHDGGRPVRALDYRAHPEAARFLTEIVERVAAETGLRVAATHRVGDLRIGDVALYAAASAGHRAEAFAACERLVEEIKRGVPIWKRQHYDDGVSEWVGL
ncbi:MULTISPECIES: molybdenum cofactor biosynthesis protein MoaE [Microbacterium]|uniref:Molybdenum cofactor biosynthesis protein MoaE n=1 Tax=Microbacterium resistens TaxID=156977 RepID=A0ABY3RQZ7_9MICO|nr:molybdenum cofactor biosynthesis protein MoaE [Microbacterium resistens]MBW1638941.1 molybdenum cofactor biosynthesis protein MoaE [Microbacterium resistens]UGS26508.1 molybdenum cofactor biosynthesis protein MoaE [Microbacterium resistens]